MYTVTCLSPACFKCDEVSNCVKIKQLFDEVRLFVLSHSLHFVSTEMESLAKTLKTKASKLYNY